MMVSERRPIWENLRIVPLSLLTFWSTPSRWPRIVLGQSCKSTKRNNGQTPHQNPSRPDDRFSLAFFDSRVQSRGRAGRPG